jgi:tRNA-Thr(GGU) m(6)t(6)A37 methyltransferase TsaA
MPPSSASEYVLRPVGFVRSSLQRLEKAPRQGAEGAPEAWIEIDARFADALAGIAEGSEILVLTWLHHADRGTLQVHPRDDLRNPLTGVFATRSSDRPNPIGLHRVIVREVAGCRVRVYPLEAVDGTPIADVKPVLAGER